MASIYSANLIAQKLFSSQLDAALPYLLSRGVDEQTAKAFGLGFCTGTKEIDDEFASLGFTKQELSDCGIYYNDWCRFAGRITFPIMDIIGRCIGFSGRAYQTSTNAAKYINSPNTRIYSKSETLYGLNLAIGAIRSKRRSVLVEGNIDCVALHSAGITNTVAPLGTSVTEAQILIFKSLGVKLDIAFDSDDAGEAAFARTKAICDRLYVECNKIDISPYQDPAECAQAKDIDRFIN